VRAERDLKASGECARPVAARGPLGGALAAAFAPVNLWPLAVLCPAVLLWLWQGVSPREAARLGFGFTTATFITGTYWLYFSVHILGQAPIWLALVLMVGLAAIMGLYQAGLGYALACWLPERAARWLIAAPAAWLLGEWWRGWFPLDFPGCRSVIRRPTAGWRFCAARGCVRPERAAVPCAPAPATLLLARLRSGASRASCSRPGSPALPSTGTSGTVPAARCRWRCAGRHLGRTRSGSRATVTTR
jgi:hypothetical protein